MNKVFQILVGADEARIAEEYQKEITNPVAGRTPGDQEPNFACGTCTAANAVQRIAEGGWDAAVLTVGPGPDGGCDFDLLRRCRLANGSIVLVVLLENVANPALYGTARQCGATRVVQRPPLPGQLRDALVGALTKGWPSDATLKLAREHGIIGTSPGLQHALWLVEKLGEDCQPVLLTGETGVGKDKLAELIHALRKVGKFVTARRRADDVAFWATELFGAGKGALGGRQEAYQGKLEESEHGTVYIPECDTLPDAVQTSLLDVADGQTYDELAGQKWLEFKGRLLFASNQDLEKLVACGKLRADLFERIKGNWIHLPPLRERREDIPALIDHFSKLRQTDNRFTGAALAALAAYDYPGNVRELENVVETTLRNCGQRWVDCEDLPENIRSAWSNGTAAAQPAAAPPAAGQTAGGVNILFPDAWFEMRHKEAHERALAAFDAVYLTRAREASGSITAAARKLGMDRKTYYEYWDKAAALNFLPPLREPGGSPPQEPPAQPGGPEAGRADACPADPGPTIIPSEPG